ncbi:hypothetical protein [Lentzea tibetensis]|uniref:hypothetical protein n=1 Tax=Lentzea tibetensis TaxID=2591470 RepID=UPI001F378E89|nr:hypothetical protein [Lentzea tibetensis]
MERVRVTVQASDPISAEGLTSYLRSRCEIEVLPAGRRAEADVAVMEMERPAVGTLSVLR